MVRFFVSLSIMFSLSCSNSQHCKPAAPQKFLTIEMSKNGSVSYQHHILIQGLSKKCDSLTVMSAVNNYLISRSSDTPISSVAVYNSTKHFDSGETLSQAKEFFADCVVEVWFDQTSGRPKQFIFSNNNGETDYEGVRWKQ